MTDLFVAALGSAASKVGLRIGSGLTAGHRNTMASFAWLEQRDRLRARVGSQPCMACLSLVACLGKPNSSLEQISETMKNATEKRDLFKSI